MSGDGLQDQLNRKVEVWISGRASCRSKLSDRLKEMSVILYQQVMGKCVAVFFVCVVDRGSLSVICRYGTV